MGGGRRVGGRRQEEEEEEEERRRRRRSSRRRQRGRYKKGSMKGALHSLFCVHYRLQLNIGVKIHIQTLSLITEHNVLV